MNTEPVSSPTCNWFEQEPGVICSSVTFDDLNGSERILCLERGCLDIYGYRLSDYARTSILCSPDHLYLKDQIIQIVVLKGIILKDCDRSNKNICDLAAQRKLTISQDAIMAYLIRKNFSNKDIENMGLKYIVIMHEIVLPVPGDDFNSFDRISFGHDRWINAARINPDGKWDKDHGFAFSVTPE